MPNREGYSDTRQQRRPIENVQDVINQQAQANGQPTTPVTSILGTNHTVVTSTPALVDTGKLLSMGNDILNGTKITPTQMGTGDGTTLTSAGDLKGQTVNQPKPIAAQGVTAGVVAAPKEVVAATGSTTTAKAPDKVTAETYDATKVDPNAVVVNGAQTAFKPTPEAAQAQVNKDAMVQSQMSELLQGMENGKLPAWAEPAAAQVDAALAARGLSRSSIGQADLTNAIIQAAMPMAQQNAQTVQQTHMANLGNQQQANMLKSQLETQVTLANLSNEQQAILQNAQMKQAALLSNQSADNAAKQFNASNKTQVDTFMANLKSQVEMSNAAQANAMAQFNASQTNAVAQFNTQIKTQNEQFNVQTQLDAGKFNAAQTNAMAQFNQQVATDVDKFNASNKQQADMFNIQNQQLVAQSNIEWRRKVATANTEMTHQSNMQNAQNQFNLSSNQLSNMWQTARDYASWAWQSGENDESRKVQLLLASQNNQAAADAAKLQANATKNTGWATAISAVTAAAVSGWFSK